MRLISYGGGVQSTAMIVLAVQGHIDAEVALWSNVGDDSEHPETVRYVREVAQPWAASHGFAVHELCKRRRDGSPSPTLREELLRPTRSIEIPVRLGDTGAPGRRTCTRDFKIKVIDRWCREHGATDDDPFTALIGISIDEIERIHNRRAGRLSRTEYPLIDLRMTRQDCRNTIERAGLPVPHKSACYFCPFNRPQYWAELRRDEPELFDAAADLEASLNERGEQLGRHRVYLTGARKPLREAITEAQPTLTFDGPQSCDEGYCWT